MKAYRDRRFVTLAVACFAVVAWFVLRVSLWASKTGNSDPIPAVVSWALFIVAIPLAVWLIHRRFRSRDGSAGGSATEDEGR